ncbi:MULTISPECIES: hypothetical protein [Paraburkholderia]|uniref:Uncharacterized protein n=1 Tax=Paraburkholderia madseniana TaxID=2599607 RepID=A0AAP5BMY6_9BURK|nr:MULTISPECIES: hypothetical protein [Paraburkholderia]MCX4151752.1 hypothetical protein [Paraburkholderia madseniana]MDN7154679.1 hypothetical protein [Paraburkholderia sp. WS6]MDQ6413562.1 hypothetical protein [Paraburkholderia madseniana]
MSDFLVTLIGAVIGDGASSVHFAAANLAGAAGTELLDRLLKTRREAARTIMLRALKEGSVTLCESDLEESVAVLYRYLRAAEEGAARRNLRLLAGVFAGQVSGQSIAADEFLYYADILSPLRREEVLLLGTLHRIWIEQCAASPDVSKRRTGTLGALKAELIPSVFEDDSDFVSVLASLTRTGLVSPFSGFGGEYYQPSPLLQRLARMVDFEAAVG